MKKNTISIQKTARYFQQGEILNSTEHLVIALHGYAQMANYFLKWFENSDFKNAVIIAPEGLHRFYWDGFSGKVVASWMTKEDREDDIKDYVNYLDTLVENLNLPKKIKITVLGFSQGAATATRWVEKTKFEIENLVLWAGVFPEDIELKTLSSKLKSPMEILFGTEDEFYNEEALKLYKNRLVNLMIPFELTIFEGKHKIYTEPLNLLYEKLKIG